MRLGGSSSIYFKSTALLPTSTSQLLSYLFPLTSFDFHLLPSVSIDFHELPYLFPSTFINFHRRLLTSTHFHSLPHRLPSISIYFHRLPPIFGSLQTDLDPLSCDFYEQPYRVRPASIGFHIFLGLIR